MELIKFILQVADLTCIFLKSLMVFVKLRFRKQLNKEIKEWEVRNLPRRTKKKNREIWYEKTGNFSTIHGFWEIFIGFREENVFSTRAYIRIQWTDFAHLRN